MLVKINKKGDIPIVILVIGVFVICGLAITSFIVSDKIVLGKSFGIELFENIFAKVEKFNFYQNIGLSNLEAANKIGAEIVDNSLLIIEEENEFLNIKYRDSNDLERSK